jgi:hypothetical protein
VKGVRAASMDLRIRVSGVLVILGLAVEGVTLFSNTPGSFLAFAFLGVGLVTLGVALFLISLITVKADGEGSR